MCGVTHKTCHLGINDFEHYLKDVKSVHVRSGVRVNDHLLSVLILSLCHFSRSDWVMVVWANDWRGSLCGTGPLWLRLLARSSLVTLGTTTLSPASLSAPSLFASSLSLSFSGVRKGLSLRVMIDTSAGLGSASLQISMEDKDELSDQCYVSTFKLNHNTQTWHRNMLN